MDVRFLHKMSTMKRTSSPYPVLRDRSDLLRLDGWKSEAWKGGTHRNEFFSLDGIVEDELTPRDAAIGVVGGPWDE